MNIIQYLKQHKGIFLLALFFSAIFAAVFYLYHLPLQAVLYPLIVCAAVGTVFCILDYHKKAQRHWDLSAIRSSADIEPRNLPKAATLETKDYQSILFMLAEEQRDLNDRMLSRYSDLSDYYTAWAHQIKTPIASMRLNLQNEDSPLARRLNADLTRIEQYTEMALAYLKLDSGAADYVIRSNDLDAIVRSAVRRFSGEFIVRKLRLNYHELHYSAVTDEKWLSFVVEQLLSNALKYTRKGAIAIRMEGDALCISDTGIGIASEDLPRIFEKGFTGLNGRNDRRASGIGLYLCRRICINLGHEISAESEVGLGTTMRIRFVQTHERPE